MDPTDRSLPVWGGLGFGRLDMTTEALHEVFRHIPDPNAERYIRSNAYDERERQSEKSSSSQAAPPQMATQAPNRPPPPLVPLPANNASIRQASTGAASDVTSGSSRMRRSSEGIPQLSSRSLGSLPSRIVPPPVPMASSHPITPIDPRTRLPPRTRPVQDAGSAGSVNHASKDSSRSSSFRRQAGHAMESLPPSPLDLSSPPERTASASSSPYNPKRSWIESSMNDGQTMSKSNAEDEKPLDLTVKKPRHSARSSDDDVILVDMKRSATGAMSERSYRKDVPVQSSSWQPHPAMVNYIHPALWPQYHNTQGKYSQGSNVGRHGYAPSSQESPTRKNLDRSPGPAMYSNRDHTVVQHPRSHNSPTVSTSHGCNQSQRPPVLAGQYSATIDQSAAVSSRRNPHAAQYSPHHKPHEYSQSTSSVPVRGYDSRYVSKVPTTTHQSAPGYSRASSSYAHSANQYSMSTTISRISPQSHSNSSHQGTAYHYGVSYTNRDSQHGHFTKHKVWTPPQMHHDKPNSNIKQNTSSMKDPSASQSSSVKSQGPTNSRQNPHYQNPDHSPRRPDPNLPTHPYHDRSDMHPRPHAGHQSRYARSSESMRDRTNSGGMARNIEHSSTSVLAPGQTPSAFHAQVTKTHAADGSSVDNPHRGRTDGKPTDSRQGFCDKDSLLRVQCKDVPSAGYEHEELRNLGPKNQIGDKKSNDMNYRDRSLPGKPCDYYEKEVLFHVQGKTKVQDCYGKDDLSLISPKDCAVMNKPVSKPFPSENSVSGSAGSVSASPSVLWEPTPAVQQKPSGEFSSSNNMFNSFSEWHAYKRRPVANVQPIRKASEDTAVSPCPQGRQSPDGEDDNSTVPSTTSSTPHQLEFMKFLSKNEDVSCATIQQNAPADVKVGRKRSADGNAKTPKRKEGKKCDAYQTPENDTKSDENELVAARRDLSLHFSTPKGRHKLFKGKQETDIGTEGDGAKYVIDTVTSDETDKTSEKSVKIDASVNEEGKVNDKLKSDEVSENACSPPVKKKRKKAAQTDSQKQQNIDTIESTKKQPDVRVKRKYVRKKPFIKKADRLKAQLALAQAQENVNETPQPVSDNRTIQPRQKRRYVRRAPRKDKTAQGDDLSQKGAKPTARHEERILKGRRRGRIGSKHIGLRRALRSARQCYAYNKNAAYEEELRREEERRLLKRVRRATKLRAENSATSGDELEPEVTDENEALVAEEPNDAADSLPTENDISGEDVSTSPTPSDDLSPVVSETPKPSPAPSPVNASKKKFKRVNRKRHGLRLSDLAVIGKKKRRRFWKPKRLPPLPLPEVNSFAEDSSELVAYEGVDTSQIFPQDLGVDEISTAASSLAENVLPCDPRRLFVRKETGESRLQKAARLGYADMVEHCLNVRGCDVNIRDNAGYTPLHECSVNGNLMVARLLLAHGAEVSAKALDGTQPIHDAVDNNNLEMTRLLLAHGADPYIANYRGRTPLKLIKSPAMKTFLTGYFADINVHAEEVIPWEVPPFWMEQDLQEGALQVFENVPGDSAAEDINLEFHFSSEKPFPLYHLLADTSIGPRNYYLLQDVTTCLAVPPNEFVLMNQNFTYLHLPQETWSTIAKECVGSSNQMDDGFTYTGVLMEECLPLELPSPYWDLKNDGPFIKEDMCVLIECNGDLNQLLDINTENLMDICLQPSWGQNDALYESYGQNYGKANGKYGKKGKEVGAARRKCLKGASGQNLPNDLPVDKAKDSSLETLLIGTVVQEEGSSQHNTVRTPCRVSLCDIKKNTCNLKCSSSTSAEQSGGENEERDSGDMVGEEFGDESQMKLLGSSMEKLQLADILSAQNSAQPTYVAKDQTAPVTENGDVNFTDETTTSLSNAQLKSGEVKTVKNHLNGCLLNGEVRATEDNLISKTGKSILARSKFGPTCNSAAAKTTNYSATLFNMLTGKDSQNSAESNVPQGKESKVSGKETHCQRKTVRSASGVTTRVGLALQGDATLPVLEKHDTEDEQSDDEKSPVICSEDREMPQLTPCAF